MDNKNLIKNNTKGGDNIIFLSEKDNEKKGSKHASIEEMRSNKHHIIYLISNFIIPYIFI